MTFLNINNSRFYQPTTGLQKVEVRSLSFRFYSSIKDDFVWTGENINPSSSSTSFNVYINLKSDRSFGVNEIKVNLSDILKISSNSSRLNINLHIIKNTNHLQLKPHEISFIKEDINKFNTILERFEYVTKSKSSLSTNNPLESHSRGLSTRYKLDSLSSIVSSLTSLINMNAITILDPDRFSSVYNSYFYHLLAKGDTCSYSDIILSVSYLDKVRVPLNVPVNTFYLHFPIKSSPATPIPSSTTLNSSLSTPLDNSLPSNS